MREERAKRLGTSFTGVSDFIGQLPALGNFLQYFLQRLTFLVRLHFEGVCDIWRLNSGIFTSNFGPMVPCHMNHSRKKTWKSRVHLYLQIKQQIIGCVDWQALCQAKFFNLVDPVGPLMPSHVFQVYKLQKTRFSSLQALDALVFSSLYGIVTHCP